MKILIVEDDVDLAEQISSHLLECGFVTRVSSDGEDGLFEGQEGGFDAAILDVGLPYMDGFTILEKWRSDGIDMPVIILTARNSKMDAVRGLELGADDYINKPFDMEEVTARLRSNIRRNNGKTAKKMQYQDILLDERAGKFLKNGSIVKLTRIEFLILQYLFINQGKTVSINQIIEHTYEDFDCDSGIIPRHIANIRKKIGSSIIQTDSNRGYYVPSDKS